MPTPLRSLSPQLCTSAPPPGHTTRPPQYPPPPTSPPPTPTPIPPDLEIGLEGPRAMSKPTLEQRIAAALTLADITSSDLEKLIAEAEAAAQSADENATKVREQALDPALTVDVVKVGAEVAAAELSRDRLRAALPRLRMRCTEIRKQEDVAAWKAEAEKLVATRDALRMEFMRICQPN